MENRVDQKTVGMPAIASALLLMVFATTGCTLTPSPSLQVDGLADNGVNQQSSAIPVMQGYLCPTCQVEPMVEYIDVDVPECIKSVAVMQYQPGCAGGCNNFPVMVRTAGVDPSCGNHPAVEKAQVRRDER